MPKILLVEDNEMNRDMLSRRLVRQGFAVATAADGQEGIRMARSEAPDLIVTDLSLPVIDGWEVTRRLKADNSTRHIPVLALSAHAMPEDLNRAMLAGCDDFDTKPVQFSRLLEKVGMLLERKCDVPKT